MKALIDINNEILCERCQHFKTYFSWSSEKQSARLVWKRRGTSFAAEKAAEFL